MTMKRLHLLDAYVTWQGGFDYYFAHVEQESEWAATKKALYNNCLQDVAKIFEDAQNIFQGYGNKWRQNLPTDDEKYFQDMGILNKLWLSKIEKVQPVLADWRREHGLLEFNQPQFRITRPIPNP